MNAMQRSLNRAAVVLAASAVALAVGLTAASAGAKNTRTQARAASGPTLLSSSVNSKLGRIVTNNAGDALYAFTRDPRNRSTCTGSCARSWVPVLGGSVAAKRGAGLNSRLVGLIRDSDGNRQATYDGHPLYRYAGDRSTRTAKGEGADQYGGYWYVLSTSGNEVRKGSGPCDPVCGSY
jgi:predicted lipoprotein with Yx(FWY)xxD motif